MDSGAWGPHRESSPALTPWPGTQGISPIKRQASCAGHRSFRRGAPHINVIPVVGTGHPRPAPPPAKIRMGGLAAGAAAPGDCGPQLPAAGRARGGPDSPPASRDPRPPRAPGAGRATGTSPGSGPSPAAPAPGRPPPPPRSPAVAPHSHGAPAPRPGRLGAWGRPVPVPDHGTAAAARPAWLPDFQRPPPAGPAPPGARAVTRASPGARGQWRAPPRPLRPARRLQRAANGVRYGTRRNRAPPRPARPMA